MRQCFSLAKESTCLQSLVRCENWARAGTELRARCAEARGGALESEESVNGGEAREEERELCGRFGAGWEYWMPSRRGFNRLIRD